MPFLDQPFADTCQALSAKIASEERRDLVVSVTDLGVLDTPRLGISVGQDRYLLRSHAVRGLLQSIGGGSAAGYIYSLRDRIQDQPLEILRGPDRSLIRTILRRELERAASVDEPVKVRLRIRRSLAPGLHPEVFAAMTPTYAPCDAPAIIRQLSDLEGSSAYSYDYASTGWTLAVQLQALQGMGEESTGYIAVWSRDNGTSALRTSAGLRMLRCTNQLAAMSGSATKRIHKGDIQIRASDLLREARLTASCGIGILQLPRAWYLRPSRRRLLRGLTRWISPCRAVAILPSAISPSSSLKSAGPQLAVR